MPTEPQNPSSTGEPNAQEAPAASPASAPQVIVDASEQPENGAGAFRQFVANILSLCLGLFLAAGMVSLADDSLVLLFRVHVLSGGSAILSFGALLVQLVIYLLAGITPVIPKRVILPFMALGVFDTFVFFPVLIYRYNWAFPLDWILSFLQVALVIGIAFWLRGEEKQCPPSEPGSGSVNIPMIGSKKMLRPMTGMLFFVGFALSSVVSTGMARDAKDTEKFVIVRTNFLGSLWNESQARASIISQDGGQSFTVPGGAIWTFGDTFKGSRSPDGKPHFAGGAVSCSIAFLRENARTNPPAFNYLVAGNQGAVSPFMYFTNEPAERFRIWPLGGIHVDGQNYLFYSVIEIFGNGQWDFRGVGAGLGRSKVALGPYERLRPHGDWHFPVEASQVIEADGWLYFFEIREAGKKQGVALARVRPNKIEEPPAYEFYSGSVAGRPAFSPRKESAALVADNVPGQVSVAWNPYLQKYVMASASDFDHPREIRFLAADAPYGPWKGPVARVEVPEYRQGKQVELAYCAYLHPELFRKNGRVMVLTYSPGLKDAGFDANCEMVEIELKPPK